MENKLTIILDPRKLRFYRREANKKQSEIADIIGVERTTYVGYAFGELCQLSINGEADDGSRQDVHKVGKNARKPSEGIQGLKQL